jgi:hypothetical protein
MGGLRLSPFGVILFGLQPEEKALQPPSASVGSFYFYPSPEQAQLGLKTKIPGTFAPGFFFVDKRFEISNLNMVRDLMKVVELLNE